MMIAYVATSWSITLELSIMLLELSIIPLENIYSTGITRDDHHVTIDMCISELLLKGKVQYNWPPN
jgi:hypothetical protein